MDLGTLHREGGDVEFTSVSEMWGDVKTLLAWLVRMQERKGQRKSVAVAHTVADVCAGLKKKNHKAPSWARCVGGLFGACLVQRQWVGGPLWVGGSVLFGGTFRRSGD